MDTFAQLKLLAEALQLGKLRLIQLYWVVGCWSVVFAGYEPILDLPCLAFDCGAALFLLQHNAAAVHVFCRLVDGRVLIDLSVLALADSLSMRRWRLQLYERGAAVLGLESVGLDFLLRCGSWIIVTLVCVIVDQLLSVRDRFTLGQNKGLDFLSGAYRSNIDSLDCAFGLH